MGISVIPHNRPWLTPRDHEAVRRVLVSEWIAQGPMVRKLEERFEKLYEGGRACAVSSGTAALFLALHAMDIGKGSQVAVPSYACSALLNAVNMTGAKPLVIDCNPNTLTLDPVVIEKEVDQIDAVIAVHTYGAKADIDRLLSSGIPIIEDCCQSLGAQIDGKPTGDQGAAAIFSFYATKIITGGQGGLIWDRSGRLAAAAENYRNFDYRKNYVPRFNLQMTDIQAAMALSQFDRLDMILQRRKFIAELYDKALPAGLLRLPHTHDESLMPYRYIVQVEDEDIISRLRQHMKEAGVTCIVPLEKHELLHRYLGLDPARFPVSEQAVRTTLSLPLYPALGDDDIDRVATALNRFQL